MSLCFLFVGTYLKGSSATGSRTKASSLDLLLVYEAEYKLIEDIACQQCIRVVDLLVDFILLHVIKFAFLVHLVDH